jgi:beta-lactamase superfamily II metal-dependent hydrolase
MYLRLRTLTQSVALTGDVENKNENLVRSPEEKRSFGKVRYIEVNNKKENTKLTLHTP